MRFMLGYMKKYAAAAAAGVILKIIGTFMLLLLPYVLEHIIDNVVPQKILWRVLVWGFVMIALAFIERILNLTSNRISIKVAKNSITDIRRDLFKRTAALSGSQTDEAGLPSLTSRLTSDALNVQGFIQNLQTFAIRAPLLVLGSIILTFTLDTVLALILCGIALLMLIVVIIISVKGIPLYDRVQKNVDASTRILRENINGIRVVKALSRSAREEKRFNEKNTELARSERKAGMIMSLPGPVTTLLLNIGLVLIVVVGARRVNDGLMQAGVILAFLTYFNFLLMGVTGLNRIFMMLSKAKASAGRIKEVIDLPEDMPVIEENAARGNKSFIEFDNVSFSYFKNVSRESGVHMAVSGISFTLERGQKLGIIGPTGCGKTTLVNLLLRFYDASEGHIYINGRDVRSYEKEELRSLFGLAAQDGIVFADSIENNISFGRSLSEEQISAASAAAMADEFIEQKGGLDYICSPRGADLSGGQKQRVLIARALAARPQILIFDDAASALDLATEAALRGALNEKYKNTSKIIISQRISSIMDADKILVMDSGKIADCGTHEELLRSCPAYRDIYEIQMEGM